MDFGISAIFAEFDKRLGKRVSGLLVICIAILILTFTLKVIAETVYGIGLVFERIGVLSNSEDTIEIALYTAGSIGIFLALFAAWVLLLRVITKRFLKNLWDVLNVLRKSADEHNARTTEFLEMERKSVELLSKAAKEMKQWEKELSAREKKLSK